MKFIHLSDLHIGKRVNEFSMLEDQKYILMKILGIIDEEHPDGIFIAGDVYDKGVPSTEAVELLDDFLVSLAKRRYQVFMISGNHDSAERLAFAGRLIETAGIHISPVYDGNIQPYILNKHNQEVHIYMLPFIKPAHVRRYFPDAEIKTYTDAVKVAIENMNLDKNVTNVLITHQFITGAERSDSEELSVGGTDNVDVSVFADFDYVALGHIHRPQNVGSEKVRYCGTPLKYSFSEASHEKSVTVVELDEKGLQVRTIPLVPNHDMVEIKGTYEEVTLKDFYENTTYQEDYVHITLTDEEDIMDAIGKLRVIYHNLMKLDYDNTRTRKSMTITGTEAVEQKSPLDLFAELYEMQNNQPMSEEQEDFVSQLIEKVWEGEK